MYHIKERWIMFGFIEREQILLKQNVYDLLHNTRIGRKGFAFILIGLFFTYLVSNAIINNISVEYILMYYVRYVFKIFGLGLTLELSRRRLHDNGYSGKLLWIWGTIASIIYTYYVYNIYSTEGLFLSFFEQIFLIEILIIFIPAALLIFLPSEQCLNKYGDSNVQMTSSTYAIGYIETKFTLSNEKGILEYLRDIYLYRSFRLTGRAKLIEAGIGVGSLGTIMGLNVNILALLLMIKSEMGIAILEPISWAIFYILYVYTLFSVFTLLIRRLHDSLYSGLWILLLVVPFANVFVFYRLFIKGSWDVNSIKEI